MEQRLIDADALWESAETCRETTGAFQDLIESAPTIDAVPVVRCGECKHWDEKPLIKNEKGMTRFGVCRLWHDGYLKADFYCADAERKEKEND